MKLSEKTCEPCKGGVPALTEEQYAPLLAQINGWHVEESKKLVKTLKFPNFKDAMDLATAIAGIAEKQNHHPDLLVKWGELRTEIWTHKINGLTESDFVLAAKIDELRS